MPKIIIGARRTGKTTKLIEESARTGAYIVCYSQSEASNIQRMAREIGKNIKFPITYLEFLNSEFFSRGARSVLIDNADTFLEFIANHNGVNLLGFSITHGQELESS